MTVKTITCRLIERDMGGKLWNPRTRWKTKPRCPRMWGTPTSPHASTPTALKSGELAH